MIPFTQECETGPSQQPVCLHGAVGFNREGARKMKATGFQNNHKTGVNGF